MAVPLNIYILISSRGMLEIEENSHFQLNTLMTLNNQTYIASVLTINKYKMG